MADAATWTLPLWSDAAQLADAIDRRSADPEAIGKTPQEWFAHLRDQGRWLDAVRVVAHALPRYHCIVWATRTLIETGALDRADPAAIAALRWIDDPRDDKRRAAAEHAGKLDDDSPGALLCQAIYLSGGSLAPEDLPPVQPDPDVCARLASGAVLVAAFADGASDPQATLQTSFAIGDSLARNG